MTKDRTSEFNTAAKHYDTQKDIDVENGLGEAVSLKNGVVVIDGKRRVGRSSSDVKRIIVNVPATPPSPPPTPPASYLKTFFQQLDGIQKMIDSLKKMVDRVDQLHTTIISSPQVDERSKNELDQVMADIRKASNEIRLQTKVMETDMSSDSSIKEGCAEWRIRKTQGRRHFTCEMTPVMTQISHVMTQISVRRQGRLRGMLYRIPRAMMLHSTMLTRFTEVMNRYHQYQNDYRENCKQRIRRGLKITGSTMTDEQIEDALESGDPSVFTQGILIETAQARQSLIDITARHDDLVKLANSIRELRDMFADLMLLVGQQGELIDNVERNVQQATDFVDSAKNETAKAVSYQSSARRKKILIIICVVVTLIVIILVIGLSVGLR